MVNGNLEYFGARGLFNGLALLGDYTTNSYWDHITGTCLHGELKGSQLAFTDFDLLYTTTAGALQMHPNVEIALSPRLNLHGRFMKLVSPVAHFILGNRLPPHFQRTVGEADTRREVMDLGLGIWTNEAHCYYPLEAIKAASSGILDTFDGQTVFIYYNTLAKAPDALYINANTVQLQDERFVFDTGVYLVNGRLCSEEGQELQVNRPQQMFTRWYGFSYTFPECKIYEG